MGYQPRERHRALAEGGRGNGTSWAGEGFSFSPAEYEGLKKLRPDLFDSDHVARRKAWIAFSQSSVGKAFRVR